MTGPIRLDVCASANCPCAARLRALAIRFVCEAEGWPELADGFIYGTPTGEPSALDAVIDVLAALRRRRQVCRPIVLDVSSADVSQE